MPWQMQQMDDVTEQKNVFSNRSRFGMFLLLSAIAGSALDFEAKEPHAEDKVRTSIDRERERESLSPTNTDRDTHKQTQTQQQAYTQA